MRRMSCRRWAAILSLMATLLPFAAEANGPKDLVFEVIDRNAAQMTVLSDSSIFTFRGKTAHGAVNPWNGKDAVDAVQLMDIGFDKLCEHLRPIYRGHRTIAIGGVQPNIIADTGQIWFQ